MTELLSFHQTKKPRRPFYCKVFELKIERLALLCLQTGIKLDLALCDFRLLTEHVKKVGVFPTQDRAPGNPTVRVIF